MAWNTQVKGADWLAGYSILFGAVLFNSERSVMELTRLLEEKKSRHFETRKMFFLAGEILISGGH